jgi:hypothetical protein
MMRRLRQLGYFTTTPKHGGSAKRIFISGHSAGGYPTSMIGIDPRWLEMLGRYEETPTSGA